MKRVFVAALSEHTGFIILWSLSKSSGRSKCNIITARAFVHPSSLAIISHKWNGIINDDRKRGIRAAKSAGDGVALRGDGDCGRREEGVRRIIVERSNERALDVGGKERGHGAHDSELERRRGRFSGRFRSDARAFRRRESVNGEVREEERSGKRLELLTSSVFLCALRVCSVARGNPRRRGAQE